MGMYEGVYPFMLIPQRQRVRREERLEYRFLYQFLTVNRGSLLSDLQEIDVQMKADFSLISFDHRKGEIKC